MKTSRQYDRVNIDPRQEAMDEWYDDERRKISAQNSSQAEKDKKDKAINLVAAFTPEHVQDAAFRIVTKDESIIKTYLFLQKIKPGESVDERKKELMEFFKPDGAFKPILAFQKMAAPGTTPDGQSGPVPRKRLYLSEFMTGTPENFPEAVSVYLHEMSHYIDIWYASLAPVFQGIKRNRRDERKSGISSEKTTDRHGTLVPEPLSGLPVTEQQSALGEHILAINADIVNKMTEPETASDTMREKLVKRNYQEEVKRVGHELAGDELTIFRQSQIALLSSGENIEIDGVIIENAYDSYSAWTVKDKNTKERKFGKLEMGYVFQKQVYAAYHDNKTEGWAENYSAWFKDKYKDELLLPAKKSIGVQTQDAAETEAEVLSRKAIDGDEQIKVSADLSTEQSPPAVSSDPQNAEERTEFQTLLRSNLKQGVQMSDELRIKMEQRLRYDFSHVKIHVDSDAARLAAMIDAQAFTIGEHIFFGSGYFMPETKEGQLLIAHELVHVIQQDKSGIKKIQKQVKSESTDSSQEIKLSMEVPFKSSLVGSAKAEFVLDVVKGANTNPVGQHAFGPEVEKGLTVSLDEKGKADLVGEAISNLITLKWDTKKSKNNQEEFGLNYYWTAEYVPFEFATGKNEWSFNSVTIAFHGVATTRADCDFFGLSGIAFYALVDAGYTIDVSVGASYTVSWDGIARTYKVAQITYKNWRGRVTAQKIDLTRTKIDQLEQSRATVDQKIETKKTDVKQSELDDMAKEKKGKGYDELKGKEKKQVRNDLYKDKKANPGKYTDDAADALEKERDAVNKQLTEQEKKLKQLKRLRRSGRDTWIKRSSRFIKGKIDKTKHWVKVRQRLLSRKAGKYVEQKLTKFAEEKITKWFGKKLGPRLAKYFTKYVAKFLAKMVAKAILHAIPVIGWILFAWDVLEVLWEFRHEIWKGIKKLWDYMLHPDHLWNDLKDAAKKWWENAQKQKFGLRDLFGKPGDDKPGGDNLSNENAAGKGDGTGTNTENINGSETPTTAEGQGTGIPGTNPEGTSETDPGTEQTNGTDPNGTTTEETNLPGNIPGDTSTGNANDTAISTGMDPNLPAPPDPSTAGGTEQQTTATTGDQQNGTPTNASTEGTSTNPNVVAETGTGNITTTVGGTSTDNPEALQKTDPNATTPKTPNTTPNTTTQTGQGSGTPGTDTTTGQQMEGVPGKKGEESTAPATSEVTENGNVIPYVPPPEDHTLLNLRWHGARSYPTSSFKQGSLYKFMLVVHYRHAGINRVALSSQAEQFIFVEESKPFPGTYVFKVDLPFIIKTDVTRIFYAKGQVVRVKLE